MAQDPNCQRPPGSLFKKWLAAERIISDKLALSTVNARDNLGFQRYMLQQGMAT